MAPTEVADTSYAAGSQARSEAGTAASGANHIILTSLPWSPSQLHRELDVSKVQTPLLLEGMVGIRTWYFAFGIQILPPTPEYLLGGLMLKLQHFEPTRWKRPWCWRRLRAGGEGGDRRWNGWMVSLAQWTWVWASSGRQWRTRKPDVL